MTRSTTIITQKKFKKLRSLTELKNIKHRLERQAMFERQQEKLSFAKMFLAGPEAGLNCNYDGVDVDDMDIEEWIPLNFKNSSVEEK